MFQFLSRLFSSDRFPHPDRAHSVLDEASEIVYARSESDYGHPYYDFSKTAAIWTVILGPKLSPGAKIEPEDVGLCQIGVKLSREIHEHRRDNLVDIAGYAETVNRVILERGRNRKPGRRGDPPGTVYSVLEEGLHPNPPAARDPSELYGKDPSVPPTRDELVEDVARRVKRKIDEYLIRILSRPTEITNEVPGGPDHKA